MNDTIAGMTWICMVCDDVRLAVCEPGECTSCGHSSWESARELGERDTLEPLQVIVLR